MDRFQILIAFGDDPGPARKHFLNRPKKDPFSDFFPHDTVDTLGQLSCLLLAPPLASHLKSTRMSCSTLPARPDATSWFVLSGCISLE